MGTLGQGSGLSESEAEQYSLFSALVPGIQVSDLKQSGVWKDHIQVREWLTAKWLSIKQVSMPILIYCINLLCTALG